MEAKDNNVEKQEKGSNSCVMDLSIGENEEEKEHKDNNEENTMVLNRSFDDINNFEKKLNLKDNFENILDLEDEDFEEEDVDKTRSKTFIVQKTNIKNT